VQLVSLGSVAQVRQGIATMVASVTFVTEALHARLDPRVHHI
jgi:hypothetical protein